MGPGLYKKQMCRETSPRWSHISRLLISPKYNEIKICIYQKFLKKNWVKTSVTNETNLTLEIHLKVSLQTFSSLDETFYLFFPSPTFSEVTSKQSADIPDRCSNFCLSIWSIWNLLVNWTISTNMHVHLSLRYNIALGAVHI